MRRKMPYKSKKSVSYGIFPSEQCLRLEAERMADSLMSKSRIEELIRNYTKKAVSLTYPKGHLVKLLLLNKVLQKLK